tara:strand:- start:605 stop:1702 length:1098 start_codon:yes stop_codon:yes gene_type:complete
MFDFVDLDFYYPLYINSLLLLVLFTLLHSAVLKIDDEKNLVFINLFGYLLLFIVILYIGQRPVSGKYFGDMKTYSRYYLKYSMGEKVTASKDVGFHYFMKSLAILVPINTFFTIIATLYIFPLYKISKEFFKEYWYYAFIMFIISYSFWTYGTNGIRNGAAGSLFLWGVSYHRKKMVMAFLFLIALQFHKTMFLPIIAFLITYKYNDPKFFLKGWLACIPLSLLMGGIWISLFASLGFGGDDRLAGYLTGEAAEGTFASTGFRWDFLFYSGFAVFAGYYFVIKKKFNDPLYFKLLNTYLICNGFWILVIKANYSNRFAYLSWFMMAIIIIYPLLKQQFFKNQHLMIGKVMVAYFAFTYFMYYVYK